MEQTGYMKRSIMRVEHFAIFGKLLSAINFRILKIPIEDKHSNCSSNCSKMLNPDQNERFSHVLFKTVLESIILFKIVVDYLNPPESIK